jgi:hypothetical protein
MKFILIALVAAASIGSTATLADTPMTPAESGRVH